MPLDSAERNTQLPGNIRLPAMLEIIRDHYSSLQPGKVGNLGLKAMEGFRIVVGVGVGAWICDQLRNLINRNTDPCFSQYHDNSC